MNSNNQAIVPVSVEDLTQSVFNHDFIAKADDWESLLSLWITCDEVEQVSQWYKGDIASKVAIKFGEESLEKFAQAVHIPYPTMVAYRRTSRAFDFNKRLLKLTWSHHFIASQVDSWDKDKKEFIGSDRFDWIEKADDGNWSAGRLRNQIAEHKAEENSDTLYQFYANSIKRFGAIITHWDITKLNKDQREDLFQTLDNLIVEFKNLLPKELST